jgi:hypothetical protein
MHRTTPLGLFDALFVSCRPNPRQLGNVGNVPSPIDVTLFGRSTVASEVHPKNAESPIDVTLLGMLTVTSVVHPKNAESRIDMTLLGISTCPLASGWY